MPVFEPKVKIKKYLQYLESEDKYKSCILPNFASTASYYLAIRNRFSTKQRDFELIRRTH